MEKEEKKQETRYFPTLATKSKDMGKAVMENPVRTHPSQMLETLHKGVEFKRNIENLSSQLQTQTREG